MPTTVMCSIQFNKDILDIVGKVVNDCGNCWLVDFHTTILAIEVCGRNRGANETL